MTHNWMCIMVFLTNKEAFESTMVYAWCDKNIAETAREFKR